MFIIFLTIIRIKCTYIINQSLNYQRKTILYFVDGTMKINLNLLIKLEEENLFYNYVSKIL